MTNEKPYTVGGRWSSLVKIPPQTWREKEGIRTPSTMNENEIITKKAEVGRVGFEPTTPAMSRLLSIENNTNGSDSIGNTSHYGKNNTINIDEFWNSFERFLS